MVAEAVSEVESRITDRGEDLALLVALQQLRILLHALDAIQRHTEESGQSANELFIQVAEVLCLGMAHTETPVITVAETNRSDHQRPGRRIGRNDLWHIRRRVVKIVDAHCTPLRNSQPREAMCCFDTLKRRLTRARRIDEHEFVVLRVEQTKHGATIQLRRGFFSDDPTGFHSPIRTEMGELLTDADERIEAGDLPLCPGEL